ncbi:MAG: aminopeptidase [Candidatus Thermoplasmatota archaeon]|nr:aminopeptidase [Candidatus Thermoplasmatota archaeon]
MAENDSNLEEELSFSPSNIWEDIEEEEHDEIFDFADDYSEFLTTAKTERKSVEEAEQILRENGFKSISEYGELEEGDKVYIINRNKSLAAAVIGKEDLTKGCNIVASHVDAPRLDLKARPLYEDKEASMALLQTHYYGGIKKYQWVNTPLAIHGKVVKEDGTPIEISIGEDPEDPIFVISDLLPHLAKKKQGERKMKKVIKGEELNILIAGIPIDDEDVESKLKTKVLKLLNDEYDIKEEDLTSAELEIVPAGKTRDVGLDRSMVGGYAHDDRVCAYTSLRALLDIDSPEKTSLIIFFDKEEIGSEGNTGANSEFVDSIYSNLLKKYKDRYTMQDRREMLDNSKALSGDVSPGINPSFKGVHDLQNAATFGKGIVITKFTGSGGKYSANDAHAEYVALVRRIFNENNILWQTSELGKVDEGGGGTVAKFLANLNIDVVDIGIPLLGMHSPFEVISKADLYHLFKGYRSFLEVE